MLIGCEGYVDPQLVENRTDGGIVAIKQAQGTYAVFDEKIRISFGLDTPLEESVHRAHSSMNPFLYINPQNLRGTLYAMRSWADPTWYYTGVDNRFFWFDGTQNTLVPGFRRCAPFFGCMPIPYTEPLYSDFETSAGFPRSYGVLAEWRYDYVCNNGHVAYPSIGWGPAVYMDNLPDSTSVPFDTANQSGIFIEPFKWKQIADDCTASGDGGYTSEWYNTGYYYDCGPGGVEDDHCYSWPNNGTCDPVPPGICGH
jgi:hypothetical protein